MYAEFYGLETPAFQLTPDPRFFFESSVHRRAMAHLTYGLHHAEGFIVITGEVGAGKTMLVDRLLSQIDCRSFLAAKIVTSQLGGDDLLRMVAAAFGLDHAGLAKATLLTQIQDFVTAKYRAGQRALLILDEAQNLSVEALEELRMLSNIVIGTGTALQSFLLGQPQFRLVLGKSALDQLRQRITAAYHLGPLNESDTRLYIEHRLRCAGWTGDPIFEDDCFAAIFHHAGGVPRQINGLCSRLLLFGFLEEHRTITCRHADEVSSELRAELAAVATNGANGKAPSLSSVYSDDAAQSSTALAERIGDLERMVASHDRGIRKMIEIMGKYLHSAPG